MIGWGGGGEEGLVQKKKNLQIADLWRLESLHPFLKSRKEISTLGRKSNL